MEGAGQNGQDTQDGTDLNSQLNQLLKTALSAPDPKCLAQNSVDAIKQLRHKFQDFEVSISGDNQKLMWQLKKNIKAATKRLLGDLFSN